MLRCTKQEAGEWGEEIAARHLQSTGMRLIGRNLEAPEAEIDILAADGADLVVIEVKTGWYPIGRLGHRPGEHFSHSDLGRRRRAATRMANAEGMHPRVDLVEILAGRGPNGVEIVHTRGAHDPSGGAPRNPAGRARSRL